MTAATEVSAAIPPLRRDWRVQSWILSGAVSEAGDVAWYVGLAWSAAQVSSPAGAGLVMGIGALPRALFLLFGGALADRLDGRRTMIVSNLGRIAVLAVAAGVVATAGLSLGLLLTVAIAFGIVDALYAGWTAGRARRARDGDGGGRDLLRGDRGRARAGPPAALPTAGAERALDPARPVRRVQVPAA
jgi:MFS family permease